MKKITMKEMNHIIDEKYFSILYKNIDIKNARLIIYMEILLFQLYKNRHDKDLDKIYDKYTKSVEMFKNE